MCEEAANTFLFILTIFLIDIRLIKCVKNLLMLTFSITVCARLLQDSRNVKKAVDGYSFTLKYVPDWYKTQEMCENVVDGCSFALKFVPDCCKTKEIGEKAVFKEFAALKYVSDCCKTLRDVWNCCSCFSFYAEILSW